uniref:Uncharacterized protein n=1 Tax=Romanomermis culicivorax TaxID=13658 RepID=A0A915K087_ROMCU
MNVFKIVKNSENAEKIVGMVQNHVQKKPSKTNCDLYAYLKNSYRFIWYQSDKKLGWLSNGFGGWQVKQ